MRIQKLIDEARELPVNQRIRLVNDLLESLNPDDKEITEEWYSEARRRSEEIESSSVETVSKQKVVNRIKSQRSDNER